MKSTNQNSADLWGRYFLLVVLILLLPGLAPQRSASASKLAVTTQLATLVEAAGSQRSRNFPCLPKGVRPDEIVSYGSKGTQPLTVEKKLIEMKARCRGGKLVDAKRREIRFFHPSCWGNPPPDYLEIRQREDKEVTELRKRYAVIVFGCNPMIQ